MLHGGRTDAHGFSLADCLLRDTHAVQFGQDISLPPIPGTLVAPGAVPTAGLTPNQLFESQRLRRARLKESFKLIVMHISDDSTLQLVGDIGSPYFQNGPDLYDHIESLVVIPPTTSELFDMKAAFMRAEIVVDVGVSEASTRMRCSGKRKGASSCTGRRRAGAQGLPSRRRAASVQERRAPHPRLVDRMAVTWRIASKLKRRNPSNLARGRRGVISYCSKSSLMSIFFAAAIVLRTVPGS